MPARRIERDHDVRRCFKIKPTECQHGSRLEREFLCVRKPCTQLPGAIAPGDLQMRNIGAIDLRQTRVVLPESVPAVIAPITIRGRLRQRAHTQTQYTDQRQEQRA